MPGSEPSAPGPYPLLRCRDCGTARTGAPAGLDEGTGGYAASGPYLARLAAPALGVFDRERLRLIRRAAAPGARLMDVGAGRGRFLAAAGRAGYEARGLEPAPARAAAARARGAAVASVALEAADVEPGSVDLASLWHVLEHVEDPAAAIARVASWLTDGGALVVAVPNLASLQARLGGERWLQWDLPRHRTHFTPAGLERLLAAHGLRVERSAHVLLEHNPFGMWQSLVSRATREPSYLYRLLTRTARPRARDLAVTVAALPLLPLAALLEAAAGALRHGGTMAVVARKRSR